MNYDDRLSLTFVTLWGATTYTGRNGETHDSLKNFTDNDIDLLKRSGIDYSYTKEAHKILNDVCDYFEATPRESLDIEYLHTESLRSHDVEESSRKQFLRNLHGQLSTAGRSCFDERMKDIHLTGSTGQGTTFREEVDFNDPAMIEAIIANTERACPNIRARTEEMERNNWIQEPTVEAITAPYKGADKIVNSGEN